MVCKKYNIILDLDNTLINAEPSSEFPFSEMQEKATKFAFYNMEDYYIVFERPYLQEFLDYLFKYHNVSVWSAGSHSYVSFIVENIILPQDKPERKVEYIFFSHHCDISKRKKKCLKDISMLYKTFKLPGFEGDNTLLIDDLEETYEFQKDKVILIKPFNILDKGSEDDTELISIQKYIEDISGCKEGEESKPVSKEEESGLESGLEENLEENVGDNPLAFSSFKEEKDLEEALEKTLEGESLENRETVSDTESNYINEGVKEMQEILDD